MKGLFVLGLVVFGGQAMAQTGKEFTIRGNIGGLSDQDLIVVTDVNNTKDTLAKAGVKKGAFLLQGKMKEPNLVVLVLGPSQKKLNLFIGNEELQVSGDINETAFQVSGSLIHADFIEFQQLFDPLFQQLNELNQKVNQSSPNDQVALQGVYREHLTRIQRAIDSFVIEKRTSPLAPFTLVVTSELTQDPELLERRFAQVEATQQKGFFGRILQQQIDDSKVGNVGSKAVQFTQNDTAGNPISLSSFRGKYVLIDFWASWCRPCRMENPNVVNAFQRFKNKNFTVLGVSLDRSRPDWLRAISDDRLTWTHVSDLKFWGNEVAQRYRVQSIPQNFLISPEGIVVAKNLRGGELMNRLCAILGCE